MLNVKKEAKILLEDKEPIVEMQGIWTIGDVGRVYRALLQARRNILKEATRKEREQNGQRPKKG